MTSKNGEDGLVAAAVAAGWKRENVEIFASSELDRDECHFFRALDKRKMDGTALELAVLPGGQVVGGDPARINKHVAADILTRCGKGASADWWAEIVTRYSGQASGRVVKSTKEASSVEEIEKRGAKFLPPTLERSGSGTVVHFFVIQSEPRRAKEVVATLSDGGDLTVTSPSDAAD